VLQAVTARTDADDDLYDEYLRRTFVRPSFIASAAAIALSVGVVVLTLPSGDDLDRRNLLLVGVGSFGASLCLILLVFLRTISLSQPASWRAMKRAVHMRAVELSTSAFIARLKRAASGHDDDSLFWGGHRYPEAAKVTAAMEALLDEVVRAMRDQSRQRVAEATDEIETIIERAMDMIEADGDIRWSPPGSRPSWPPLNTLHDRTLTFRERVHAGASRDDIFVLRGMDYWAMSRGVRRGCGELFTVGLDGYYWGYRAAVSAGDRELIELVVDSVWTSMRGASIDQVHAEDSSVTSPDELWPYVRQLVRQMERLMSMAMLHERPDHFRQFREGFAGVLRHLRFTWEADVYPPTPATARFEDTQRAYRVSCLGLGGRALILAREGRLADPSPYLDVVRDMYPSARGLDLDLKYALDSRYEDDFLWDSWESEGAGDLEFRSIDTARYPLSFFTFRLLELAQDSEPVVSLGSQASQAKQWFDRNVDWVESLLPEEPQNVE